MSSSTPIHKSFTLQAISNLLDSKVNSDDISTDIEGEQSTIPDLEEDDFEKDDEDRERASSFNMSKSTPSSKINVLAKGVADKTAEEYELLAKQCCHFLIQNGLIQSSNQFFSSNPSPAAPSLICAWILSECDTVDINNHPLSPEIVWSSYSHAQKMRACMTYTFGRWYGLNKQAWQERQTEHGTICSGNPSVSELVSRYMLSLHRRKIKKGDIATSARAIDINILAQLYDYNNSPAADLQTRQENNENSNLSKIHRWGGRLVRIALHAIYLFAFLCLLRIDEVLKIDFNQIQIEENKITLTLWFRKTHQYGDIKPFVLHRLPEYESYLCPVRALGAWIKASQITDGYVFRRMVNGERPTGSNKAMTSEQFLSMFRQNLMDIGIEPGPYGTHSFRRGGCQYLASGRRWPLRRICEWGGWSQEFTNLTIVKYLISWNDDPNESREDFFNPNMQATIKCPSCGRLCACA